MNHENPPSVQVPDLMSTEDLETAGRGSPNNTEINTGGPSAASLATVGDADLVAGNEADHSAFKDFLKAFEDYHDTIKAQIKTLRDHEVKLEQKKAEFEDEKAKFEDEKARFEFEKEKAQFQKDKAQFEEDRASLEVKQQKVRKDEEDVFKWATQVELDSNQKKLKFAMAVEKTLAFLNEEVNQSEDKDAAAAVLKHELEMPTVDRTMIFQFTKIPAHWDDEDFTEAMLRFGTVARVTLYGEHPVSRKQNGLVVFSTLGPFELSTSDAGFVHLFEDEVFSMDYRRLFALNE